MSQKKVIITKLSIDRPKQVALFELKIPREVKNIIGVDTNLRWVSGVIPKSRPNDPWVTPVIVKRDMYIGDLKLQSLAKPNIFYQCDVSLDNNIGQGDYSGRWLVPKLYTHQGHSVPDEIILSGTNTILKGFYKDNLADHFVGSYHYEVSVYIWLELKDN